jgi:hypothetical protein
MTFTKVQTGFLTDEEWEELVVLKKAINENPASVHPSKQEKFSELMVRSLQERGG